MKTRRQWLTQAAALTLGACSQRPPAASPWLVWNRAAFGAGAEACLSLEEFLEQQLHPERIDDSACESRLKLPTLSKSFDQLWREHYLAADEAETEEDWDWVYLSYSESVQGAFLRAIHSRRQLQERMVHFWHNHFSVYGLHDDVAPLFGAFDRDAIRPHVLGNFARMLGAVVRHPVMLLYLNNSSNVVAGPNENFARELLELHTLGAVHYLGAVDPRQVPRNAEGLALAYVDNDVYEVARCFTGWTLDESDSDDVSGGTGHFRYRADLHDRFNKLVLGQYVRNDQGVEADGEAVLGLLARHPGTAYHVCWKLCRHLVADEPPTALVERAARTFQENLEAPDQLAQVVALILRSPEFAVSAGQKMKNPFEFTVSLARALQWQGEPDEDFLTAYDRLGQPLFGRPSPDGYPDQATAWRHTSSLVFRWKLAHQLVQGCRPEQALLQHFPTRSPGQSLALLAMSPEFQVS